MEPPATSRRTLLALGASLAGAAVAALAGVPVLGALLAPLRDRGPAGASPFVDVAASAALPVGRRARVPLVEDRRDGWERASVEVGAVWLTRDAAGLRCFSAVCPHLGCAVDAAPDGGYVCPCHGSTFAADGAARAGPAPRGLDPLAVREDQGRILVRWERFATGLSRRKPA